MKRNTFWKFNCSLLKDKKYIDEINDEINNVIEQYAAPHYDKASISGIAKSDLELTVSDKVFLDFLLMKIRARTISYATMKKKKTREKEDSLLRDIKLFEEKESKTETDIKHIAEKNKELVSLRKKTMEGVLLRSKARWVAEGEKISKYCCNLEKRHYVSKQMIKLIDAKGEEIKEQLDINKEVNNFYSNLYKAKDLEECEIEQLVTEIPKLSEEESRSLEGKITIEEAGTALKNMKHEKSPGTDGFGAEFFKCFWKQLGPFVVRALNKAFEDGELSTTQKEGIITCIPKGDKPRDNIKNWRPISLLNVIYKIGSSCIANRIKRVLPSLIDDDQTGFISNRYMGDNVRLIYDLINYLNTKNKPGLLLCLDFEKAFDSLDWRFMFRALRAFGFGKDLCRWIDTFYKNIKSTVIVNGQTTQWFTVERGCRQGDPISPYIFILCVEILAIMIREDSDIKGIWINKVEHKISQFADDTQLMNNGEKKSFEKSIDAINKFGKVSGLFLNADKTQAIWLGSQKYSRVKYMPHLKMVWNPTMFKILGIWFTQDLKECATINYNKNFDEVKKLFKIWSLRTITPLGRVAVLKSLILSKLIHLWILLPDPPDNFVKDLQKICFQFVWNGKQDRIARKTTIKDVKSGLNIPDIKTYILALKLTWIKKLKISNHKWRNIPMELYPFLHQLECYGPCFFNQTVKNNSFWADVFKAYGIFCSKVKPNSTSQLLSEPVFYNKNMMIGNKMIKYTQWVDNGVYFIAHFIKENGRFCTLAEFNTKYGMTVDFLTFNSCTSSIKQYIKKSTILISNNMADEVNMSLSTIYSAPKGARLYYNIIVNDNCMPNCCLKWSEKLKSNISWNTVFIKVQKIKDVKLKWLQMRIIHRIIATNIVLNKMGVTANTQCGFCNDKKDSIEHMFWKCACTRRFWTSLETILKEKCETALNVKFTQNLVFFGTEIDIKTDTVFDLVILQAKQFIYKCKLDKCLPTLSCFLQQLMLKHKIDEYNAKISGELPTFIVNWLCYKPILKTEN